MKRTIHFILPFLILITIFALPLQAQPPAPTDLLLQGNKLYENGQFVEAANVYQQLVERGLQNSIVFYNLGNAYFKQGDIGRAILNYRRAERLAPRDPDIRANLSLVRAQTVDKIQADNANFLSQWVTLAQNWLTLNEMAVLALALWVVLSGLMITFIFLRPGRLRTITLYGVVALALLLGIGLALMGERMVVEKTRPAGVIVADEVNATSGPGDQYVTEFTLHSGAEVGLIETREHWVRLTLPGNQLQGWVPAEAVEAVQK